MGNSASSYAISLTEKSLTELRGMVSSDGEILAKSLTRESLSEPCGRSHSFAGSEELVSSEVRTTHFTESKEKAELAQWGHLVGDQEFDSMVGSIILSLVHLSGKAQSSSDLPQCWNSLIDLHHQFLHKEAYERKKKESLGQTESLFRPSVSRPVKAGLRFVLKMVVHLARNDIAAFVEALEPVVSECNIGDFAGDEWAFVQEEILPVTQFLKPALHLQLNFLQNDFQGLLKILTQPPDLEIDSNTETVLKGFVDYVQNFCCLPAKFDLNNPCCSGSEDTLTSNTLLESTTVIQNPLTAGAFYLEVNVEKVGDGTSIGLVPWGDLQASTFLYQSNGTFNGSSKDGFSDGDNVGILVDFLSDSVKVFKNKEEVSSASFGFVMGQIVIRTKGKAKVCLLKNVETPTLPEYTAFLNSKDKTDEEELKNWKEFITNALGRSAKKLSTALEQCENCPISLQRHAYITCPTSETFSALQALLQAQHSEETFINLLYILKVQLQVVSKLQMKRDIALLEGISEQLHGIRLNPEVSAEVKNTVVGIFTDVYDLFFEDANAKIDDLIRIIKGTREEDTELNKSILKGYSSPIKLSLLLLEVSEDKLEGFQQVLLGCIHQKEFSELLKGYLIVLYSHTARCEKEVYKKLMQEASVQILQFAYNQFYETLDLEALVKQLEVVRLMLWVIPIIELDTTFLYKILPIVSDLYRQLRTVKIPAQEFEVKVEEEEIQSPKPCPPETYKHEISSKKQILSVKITVSGHKALVHDRGVKVSEIESGEITIERPKDTSVTLTVEEEVESYSIKLEKTCKQPIWYLSTLEEVQLITKGVYLRICELLITSTSDDNSIFSNILVQGGIAEEAWSLINCPKEVTADLKELTELSVEDEPAELGRSFSVAIGKERKQVDAFSACSKSLKDYFLSFDAQPHFKYDKNAFLEMLIDNKTTSFWTLLTQESGLKQSPHNSLGGSEGERAERAVLAVLMKIFYHPSMFESLFETTGKFPSALIDLRKKAHEIRQWLRQQLQKEKDVEELSKLAVQKCIILLNCDFYDTVERIGVLNVQSSSSGRERSSSMGHISDLTEWQDSRNMPILLKKAKLLSKKLKKEKVSLKDTKEKRIHKLVMEFVTDEKEITEMATEMNKVRNQCIARIAGLNFISKLLDEGNLAMVSQTLNRVFIKQNTKMHYSDGLNGCDYSLKKALGRTFFYLYKQLADRLAELLQREPNWLSDTNYEIILQVASALAVPFKQIDSEYLLNIDLHKPLNLLLDIAKGKIKNAEKRSIDSSKTITDFSFRDTSEENWIELEDKLYLKPEFGDNPITNIKIGEVGGEGMTKMPQVLANGRFIWVSRAPHDLNLTGIKVEDGEIVPTYETASKLYKEIDSAKNETRVSDLKWCFWNLVKCFSFTIAGRPEEEWESSQVSTPSLKLKETIMYIIFNEVSNFDSEEDSSVELKLTEAVNGQNWGKPFNCASSNLQILDYIEKIASDKCNSLPETIQHYRKVDLKLTGKAVSVQSFKEEFDINIKDDWLNSNGEFDLFLMIKSIQKNPDSDALSENSVEFIQKSPILKILPDDMSSTHIEWPNEFLDIPSYLSSLSVPSSLKDLVQKLGNAPQPGVLELNEAQELIEEIDNSWINSEGKFDIFSMMNSIIHDPQSERNQIYSGELQSELSKSHYAVPPPSVHFINLLKPQKSLNFIHSFFWLFYSLLSSKSSKMIIGRQEFVREISAVAFRINSPASSVYALNILEHIIEDSFTASSVDSCIDIDTAIWYDYFGSNFVSSGFCEAIFALAGLQLSQNIRSKSRKSLGSAQKTALCFPAIRIVQRLMNNSNWQASVVQKVSEITKSLEAMLEDPVKMLEDIVGRYHVITGFLAGVVGHPAVKGIAEWNQVKRKSGEVGTEYLISYGDKPSVFRKLHKQVENVESDDISHCFVDDLVNFSNLAEDSQRGILQFCLDLLRINFKVNQVCLENTNSVLIHRGFMNIFVNDASVLLGILAPLNVVSEENAESALELLLPLVQDTSSNIVGQEYEIIKLELMKKLSSDIKKADEVVNEEVKGEEREEENKEVEINNLYMLGAEESKQFSCLSEDFNVNYIVNKIFHHTVKKIKPSVFPVNLETPVDCSIFRHVTSKEGCLSLTFFIAVSASANSVFEINLGGLSILVKSFENAECEVNSDTSLFKHMENKENYEFRIIAHHNYKVEVSCLTFEKSCELFVNSDFVYNGFTVGKFKLTMLEGDSLTLKGFSIYENNVRKALNFWKDFPTVESAHYKDRVATIKTISSSDPLTMLLSNTGLSEESQGSIYSSSLQKSLTKLVDMNVSEVGVSWTACLKDPIVDLKILEMGEEIPVDYRIVPFWNKETEIKGKVLVYKTAPFGKASRLLTALTIQKEEKVGGSSELVGGLHFEGSDYAPSYVVCSWSSLKGEIPSYISDLIFIDTTNSPVCEIPGGFSVVIYTYQEKNNAIGTPVLNLTDSDERLVFLASAANSSIFNLPVKSLVQNRRAEVMSTNGLVNSIEESSAVSSEDKKTLAALSTAVSNYSFHELLSYSYKLERQFISSAAVNSLFELTKPYPKLLPSCLSKQDMIRKLLKTAKLSQLSSMIKSALSCNDNKFTLALVMEILGQLMVSNNNYSKIARGLRIEKESPHPYNNNMDVYDDLSIPGANTLTVEFDSQTHTENGCDPLRFYSDSERKNMIYEYSGELSNFKTFVVEGDTLHMWFHTDSSVVYWGYKFTVTPSYAFVDSLPVRHPFAFNADKILSLYESVFTIEKHPVFFSPLLVSQLLVLAHSTESAGLISKILKVFTNVLSSEIEYPSKSLSLPEYSREAFLERVAEVRAKEMKGEEAFDTAVSFLYKQLKILSSTTAKTPAIYNNLLETQLRFNREEKDMLKLRNIMDLTFSFSMRGVNLMWALANYFSEKIEPLEIFEESSHPYRGLISKEIILPGVRRVQIKVDGQSKLEESHNLVVSKDIEAQENWEVSGDFQTKSALEFNQQTTAKYLKLTNDNTQVSRNSTSGGWNISICKQTVSKGKFRVTLIFTNVSDASDMLVGVHEHKEGLSLTDYTGNEGWGTKSYTYQLSGSTSPSSSSSVPTGNTKDEIDIEGDLNTKILTFSINQQVFATFEQIEITVAAFHVCLGCTKKNSVTIKECLVSSDSNNIANQSFNVFSDRFFVHYPVNYAYIPSRNMDWDNGTEVSVDALTLTKTNEGTEAFYTKKSLMYGIYQVDFVVRHLREGNAMLGIFTKNLQPEQALSSPDCFLYCSTGQVNFNCINHELPKYTDGDMIRFIVDIENASISIYKNWELVLQEQVKIKTTKLPHYMGAVLDTPKQSVSLYKDEIHSELMSKCCTKESKYWGVKLGIRPIFTLGDSFEFLSMLEDSTLKNFSEFVQNHLDYSLEYEKQLVSYLDDYCIRNDVLPKTINIDTLEISASDKLKFKVFENQEETLVKQRMKLVIWANGQICDGINKIDIKFPPNSELTGFLKHLVKCQSFVLYVDKHNMLKRMLDESKGSKQNEITIDKINAVIMREQGSKDTNGTISVYAQIMKEINTWPGEDLRNPDRVYCVNFLNEGATDAGGPYNETFSLMCDELMSDFLPLFVSSPNALGDIGQNRDCFVVNPDCSAMHMYTFLGKLLGIAIRTQNNLNLMLAPIFWKKICRQELGLQDLKDFDENAFQAIDMLNNPSSRGLTTEDLESVLEDLNFTTKNSAGTTVLLSVNGHSLPVTVSNLKEYIDKVTQIRLHENEEVYKRIRDGMSMVVPVDIIGLFAWNQLERLVCGNPTIVVDRLKGNCSYDGYTEDEPTIGFFWEALEEFTNDERRMFLRFVWGRSRLPATGSFKTFTITKMHSDTPDATLPVSHTCFFTIDLPPYTSKDALKKKTLYAITHCQAIDLDHDVGGEEE